MADKAPLFFDVRLGGLFPASAAAEEAMSEIKGRVTVKITGGKANQRRRSLYWRVASLVVPLLNQKFQMTLDDDDLHDITRDKLKLVEKIDLPSGDVHLKRRSTSNRKMNEAERSAYTTRAFELWSTWTGVDVTTLTDEAERLAA
jgi:hypothetical protein